MKGLTSIIMTSYDHTILLRKITSASLGSISKHTDPDDYELILVDNANNNIGLNTREHFIKIDKHIKNPENLGCSRGNNQGVEASDPTTKYLCFIHNDVFVSNNWLPRLRKYLEDGRWDIVYPHQGPTPRDMFVKWENMSFEERILERGTDDGGLILMTREAYNKTGGWDERFKYLWHDFAFRYQCAKAKLKETKFVAEAVITHIGGAVMVQDEKILDDAYKQESEIVNELTAKYKNL